MGVGGEYLGGDEERKNCDQYVLYKIIFNNKK